MPIRRRISTATSGPTTAASSSAIDSATGADPTYALGSAARSVQHQATPSPPRSPPLQSSASQRRIERVPSSPVATRNGTCQHTAGFQSIGRSPSSTADRCNAQPAPPSNPGRLKKMQAPSTTRVCEWDESANTPPSAACSAIWNRAGSKLIPSAPMTAASSSNTSAPTEQHPCCRAAAGRSRMPSHPAPQMQRQDDAMNAMSTSHSVPSMGSINRSEPLTIPLV